MAVNRLVSVEEPDVREAVREFISMYVRPEVALDNIVEGWSRHDALNNAVSEYIVFTIEKLSRIMTNLECYEVNGTLRQYMLVEAEIGIHSCSADEESARKRANSLAAMAGSRSGCSLFEAYQIGLLYTDPAERIETDPDTGRDKGYRTVLHLSWYSIVSEESEGFDRIEPHLINVDVHYPPEEIQ